MASYTDAHDGVHRLLNRTIVVEDPTVLARLQPYLAQDILPALKAMTGATFVMRSSFRRRGVIRVRTSPDIPKQGYRIKASQKTDTLITGAGWRGCMFGLYAWLEALGCERLGMGDAFLLRPKRGDLRIRLNTTNAPRMSSMAWGWQNTTSGGRWPFGNGDEKDYFAHFRQRDEFMRWARRPRASYGSTVPSEQALLVGIQSDGGFYNSNLAALSQIPQVFAQYGKTWKPNTNYSAGVDVVVCNGNTYVRLVDGVSAAIGTGPSGTGDKIPDGDVAEAWAFVEAGERNGANHASFHMTHEGHPTGTDYSGNGGMTGLYTDWIVGLKDSNDARSVPEFEDCDLSLGVAVSDGSPQCRDDKCEDLLRNGAMGVIINADANATDKTLWRAAKIVTAAKLRRGGRWTVTEYAYDAQVRVPTPGYTVHPDIFVQLANYAFEAQDGTPRSIRLRMWGDRSKLDGFQLGVYEFWALPQYNQSDPRFPASLAWRRFREWLDNNVTLFQSESPISLGAVGIHMWGAFKMCWQGPRSYESLMSEWCRKAFGRGAAYIRKTLDRWWALEFPATPLAMYDLALDFQNFLDAQNAVTTPEDLRRVTVWQSYLLSQHYRRVFADLGQNPSQAEAEAVGQAWLTHTWRSHHLYAVDCVHDHDVVLVNRGLSAEFKTRWTIPGDPREYPAWRAANGITDYADVEVRNLFAAVYATYTQPQVVTYPPPDFSSLVAPYITDDPTLVESAYLYGGYAGEQGAELLFGARPGTTAKIVLGFSAPVQNSFVHIGIQTATGSPVEDFLMPTPRTVTGDGSTYEIDLAALTPGFYRLRIESHAAANGWRIQSCPRSVPLTLLGPTALPLWGDPTAGGWPWGMQPRYFPVPRGTPAGHLNFEGQNASFVIRNPDKAIVVPTGLGRGSYRLDIPPEHTGTVWRMESTGQPTGTARLWDLPNWFSPTREQAILSSGWL